MPSGKTHDAITFLFAAPIFAASWQMVGNASVAAVVTIAYLFGGLMFGPDLDTLSQQYSRWGTFRFVWFPYQAFFSHRSRWSHGLTFGTLFRVIYFMGAMTLAAFAAVYVYASWSGGELPNLGEFTKVWFGIGAYLQAKVGGNALLALFFGLWIGAASHTLTDMAGTFVKTGRITEFL